MSALIGAVWALCAGVGAGTAAQAVDPISLGDSHVTDDAGVLSPADETAANARLAATYESTGIDLYVVLVEDFTNPSDRIAWANETADLNGLGEEQYLLAVATEGRQYFISSLEGGPLSNGQLEKIEENILPALRDSDWSGAITAAADSVESANGAGGRTAAIVVGSLVGVAGVGCAAFGITRMVKRRRSRSELAAELVELRRTAGSALVAADDAIKTSAQELEFARAQFGDASVVAYAAALDVAKAQLIEAFGLQQQLDDAVPDTDEQRREWLTRVIELCTSADEALDVQTQSFVQLRSIEKDPVSALAVVQQRLSGLGAGETGAPATLEALRARFAEDELTAVAGNPAQAVEILGFARERLVAGQQAIDAANNGEAAVLIRDAEAAVSQAEGLHAALDGHEAKLAEAAERCAALIAELQTDVASAQTTSDPDGRVATAIAATAQQVATAQSYLSGAGQRPTAALQALEAANANIDGVVAAARDAERAQQLLVATLSSAGESVRQAEAYIESRRGAVGATARTRASEARAALIRAEQASTTDPKTSLSEAQRAAQLGAAALQSARGDVEGFGGGYGGGYSGGFSGGYAGGNSSSGSDLGAILGGLLGGSGNSRGGWGGSGGSWGGSSRSSGGSSRRSSGSSGGSRRSSGGGRF